MATIMHKEQREEKHNFLLYVVSHLVLFFNFLIMRSWENELVGYELPSHNKSCGHGCHASMKLQETVMCFEDRPGIIQACIWLSQVEGKLRECLRS